MSIDQVADGLAQLAFQEWIDWLSGRKRYDSRTDQAIGRVIDIYTLVMPDREPDVPFIYNRLNIPYGRARYIVQAIVNRELYDLNARALDRLIDALQTKANELDALNDDERKVLQEIRFTIDPRQEKMLTTIIDQMPLSSRPVSTFKRIPTPGAASCSPKAGPGQFRNSRPAEARSPRPHSGSGRGSGPESLVHALCAGQRPV